MKLIEQSVECLKALTEEHKIEIAARVCYASEPKDDDVYDFINRIWAHGHKSPFRHGTMYFESTIGSCDLSFLIDNPYIEYVILNQYVYFSTNYQYAKEHEHLITQHNIKRVDEEYIRQLSIKFPHINLILRFGFIVITQISTSRELNRVSPNNICEQSTRYCNFSKDKFDGEIKICKPYWYDDASVVEKEAFNAACKSAENSYFACLNYGSKPQDARECLPLSTATKCVYTYSLKEWENIINLRYYGISGKPHPNAKIIADKIRKKLNILQNYTCFEEDKITYNDLGRNKENI